MGFSLIFILFLIMDLILLRISYKKKRFGLLFLSLSGLILISLVLVSVIFFFPDYL
ncbi:MULTISPECIES: hypothetical protein [unclassified Enterococcus]|jgi:hypothetical protein|uniref:hypothetical protein n=1 Tax=unclassified Enterococcus TaxID=2608891 RepID=UPI000B209670|nr:MULTISPECIES: hypothetical protein [unclassified Enterococcus]